MSIYKGFGLVGTPTSGFTIHAQALAEAGKWSGSGWVGFMPDRKSAHLYIDWLHTQTPQEARASRLQDAIPGHAVFLHGAAGPEQADLLGEPARIAQVVREFLAAHTAHEMSDRDGFNRSEDLFKAIYSRMIRAVAAMEDAAKQEKSASRDGNFFIWRKRPQDDVFSLNITNAIPEDPWAGHGQIATGLGEEWFHTIVDYLKSRSITNYSNFPGLTAANKSRVYACDTFVDGPEPLIDQDHRERLKAAAKSFVALGANPRPGFDHQAALENVIRELEDIADAIQAPIPPHTP